MCKVAFLLIIPTTAIYTRENKTPLYLSVVQQSVKRSPPRLPKVEECEPRPPVTSN